MIRIAVEVREGADRFEVTARADSISQAVVSTGQDFPGADVRVVFPIDGEEFFGGRGATGGRIEDRGQPRPLAERVH